MSASLAELQTHLQQMERELYRLRQLVAAEPFHPAPFLRRKDLARLLRLSTEEIRTNEARLGLDIARRDLNRRNVRYLTPIALQQLALRGEIEPNQIPTAAHR